MYNPFVVFNTKLFAALRKAGHTHFVRQHYPRGSRPLPGGTKGSFLISHYNNINQAQIHLQALNNSPEAFLYDVGQADHLARLDIAVAGTPGYLIYSPILPGPWKPGPDIAKLVRTYIARSLPWEPGRGNQVSTQLFIQFGQLFLTLRYRSDEVKIPFSDIEKL